MAASSSKPVALIPAYKPPEALRSLVDELCSRDLFEKIYILDDGNGTEMRSFFGSLAGPRVEILHHAVNLGKGMALRTGLNVIACSHPTSPGVITLDADGQHLPEDAAKLAEAMQTDPDSLVLGVRELPASAPWRSRFGNRLTRNVLAFFTGLRLTDTQTGLRGIPLNLIRDLLPLKSVGYDFELDMLILAHRKGTRFIEIPIEAVYIDDNAGSHFNPVIDSMKIYFVFARFFSVSLMTAAIDYAVFFLTFLLGESLLVSLLVARSVAASFQFLMSYSFVFHDRQKRARALVKYGLVLCALTTLAFFGMKAFYEFLGVSPLVSKVVVEGSIFVASFLLLRDFVFSPSDSD